MTYTFEPNLASIARLAFERGGEVEIAVTREAEQVVERAKSLAPRRTGALAAGIHYELDVDEHGLDARVSYDAAQWYGIFAELGTSKESPRPFLRPALDG